MLEITPYLVCETISARTNKKRKYILYSFYNFLKEYFQQKLLYSKVKYNETNPAPRKFSVS